jgi:hypothetical protein
MTQRTIAFRLSVADFFTQHNWVGRRIPAAWTPAINADDGEDDELSFRFFDPQQALTWTVKDYFSTFSWQEGTEQRPQRMMRPRGQQAMKLSVNEYFKFLDWEGNPTVAAHPEVFSTPENDSMSAGIFSANTFSELF